MQHKILVVDDDIALAKTLESILNDAGYDVILAHTAEDGLNAALSEQPDLALLDVMIPNMGGWEACRRLREFSDIPILFLTALGNMENVVRGLEMGADDYMVKPFRQPEILARIKAHLRRMMSLNKLEKHFAFGSDEISVDVPAHSVLIDGQEVELTPREFQLLLVLVRNAGRVVTTADLVRMAWGLKDEQAVDNIKPYIHYLRKKIERDPAAPRWIKTVRGVGYRFEDE